MMGTSAVLHDDITEYYHLPEIPYQLEARHAETLDLIELELLVTDSETGKPISNALISLDSINRTAVCDHQGKALIKEILPGDMILDVIVWGYRASSTTLFLSGWQHNSRHIKMTRNC